MMIGYYTYCKYLADGRSKNREPPAARGERMLTAFQRLIRNPKFLRFAYNPKLISAINKIGLAAPLRNYHYRSVVRSDGVYRASLHGLEAAFRVPIPHDLLRVEYTLSTEAPVLETILRTLRAGDVFLDIGANVGVYTVLSARAVGEAGCVAAFEPEIQRFERLQENLTLNGLGNVRPFRVALGEAEGEARLYVKGPPSPSLVAPQGRVAASAECAMVKVVNGDEYWKAQGLPPPRVVKIDVEGYELSVLKGLRGLLSGPATTFLACEIHPWAGVTVQDVRELLASMRFGNVTTTRRQGEVHMLARKEPFGSR
jgi:FkbM family methyltransferase